MFLSCLLIETGINPDRPRPGRTWLRNLYHVHQRLCMAFPSAEHKSEDKQFLRPFSPDDFGNGQVHVKRADDSGFLFRIDPVPDGRAVILVQSAVKPDWDYAFQNARFLLAAPAEVKEYEPGYVAGKRLRFRLAANPTRRLSQHSRERDGKPVAEKWIGKRVPLPADQLHHWLTRQAEAGGFSLDKDSTTVQAGYIYVNKGREEGGQRLRSVRYDGILEVTDPDKFRNALLRGIGPAKAFGFGLLSVAPL
ncbi:MAG: type I-E CRISPR-associated protein Cas6/Cse3/CasE [Terriglobia bacterium]